MIPALSLFADLSPTAENFMRELRAVARRRLVPEDLEPAHTRWQSGQELLEAGLVARTIHTDGRTTYRLTAAEKKRRAA